MENTNMLNLKTKKSSLIYWKILSACFFLHASMAYSQNMREYVLSEVHIENTLLRLFLDSVVQQEKSCSHYKEGFIWSVNFDSSCYLKGKIEVSYGTGVPSAFGCFYIDDVLFMVGGDYVESIVSMSDKTDTLLFEINTTELPVTEDYSFWELVYDGGVLAVKKSYPVRCSQSKSD